MLATASGCGPEIDPHDAGSTPAPLVAALCGGTNQPCCYLLDDPTPTCVAPNEPTFDSGGCACKRPPRPPGEPNPCLGLSCGVGTDGKTTCGMCAADYVCSAGICVFEPPPGASCNTDSDCFATGGFTSKCCRGTCADRCLAPFQQ
jgi:hypothetical protein